MQPGVVELLTDLRRCLRSLGVRWYLFGAQAVIAHGVPRMSDDVDVTVDLGHHQAAELVRALEASGFQLRIEDDIDAFVRQTRVLPMTHRRSGVDLDVVLAGPGPEEGFLQRARRLSLGGVLVPVVTVEDLLVLKTLAGRGKDLDDVAGVVRRKGGRYEVTAVRARLRELEQALDRSDLVAEFDRIAGGLTPGGVAPKKKRAAARRGRSKRG